MEVNIEAICQWWQSIYVICWVVCVHKPQKSTPSIWHQHKSILCKRNRGCTDACGHGDNFQSSSKHGRLVSRSYFCSGSNCVTKPLCLNIQMCVLPVILAFQRPISNCCDLMLGSVRWRVHVYEPCCVWERESGAYFVVFNVIFTANSKRWQTKLWIWITNDKAIKKRLQILETENPPCWVDKCLLQVSNDLRIC